MLDHLSDREFNEIFKKISESKEFDYNPDAWAEIKPRLERRKRKKRFIIWFTFGIGLLAITTLMYIAIGKSQDTGVVNKHKTEGIVPSLPLQIDENVENRAQGFTEGNTQNQTQTQTNLGSIKDDNSKLDLSETVSNTERKPTKGSLRLESALDLHSSIQTIASEGSKSKDIEPAENKILKSEDHPAGLAINPTAENPLSASEISEDQKFGHPIVKNKNSEGNKLKDENSHLNFQSFNLSKLALTPLYVDLTPLILNQDHYVRNDTKNAQKNQFFGFEFYVAQERSTSNTSYFRSPDYKFGLSINYAINTHLSAYLGVGIHTDNYGVGQGLYKPPAGFWTNGVAPRYTSATCKIIDIPVGLTYQFSDQSKDGLFISMGVTSIFMLQEEYAYTYTEDNPMLRQKWTGSNANNHLFNDLYISTGYNIRSGDKFFFKLAPYFHLPLKGIGHGNLKLYTIGFKGSVVFQTFK